MPRRFLFLLIFGLLALAPVAEGGWFDQIDLTFRFEATQNGREHPASRSFSAIVPQDCPLGLEYCMRFSARGPAVP